MVDYNLERFLSFVEIEHSSLVRDNCHKIIKQYPERDPFQILKEVLLDLNKDLGRDIYHFMNSRYDS